MKKHILPIILVFVSIILTACGNTATPEPVMEAKSNGDSTVVAEGTLLPDPSVELSFALPGIISNVLVEEGDVVKEGEVIAQLENIEAVQAEVARAEEVYLLAEQAFNVSASTAQQKLPDAHHAFDMAQDNFDNFDIPSDLRDLGTREALSYTYSKLEEARKNFEPYKYMEEQLDREMANDDPANPKVYRDTPKIYKKRLDDAWAEYRKAIQWAEHEANLEFAKANLQNAQKELDNLTAGESSVAGAQFESARANLDAAHTALENYQLRAPFTGTLLSLDISVGEAVNAGMPIAYLGSKDRWRVETKDLAEIDVANVSIGNKVIIKLDAFPNEEFSGTVTQVDPVGREYLGDMTYKTTITLDKSDSRFLWNMTATVTIKVK
jgi:HlyD family secretion protein